MRGAGRGFCAGYDVTSGDMAARGVPADRLQLEAILRGWLEIWDLPLPVIAQVHGACLAGGTQLAAICDVTFVADDARVGTPQLPLGAGYVASFWAWFVGPKKAKEVFFETGAVISAAEAVSMGLFNRVVPAADLEGAVQAYARRRRSPAEGPPRTAEAGDQPDAGGPRLPPGPPPGGRGRRHRARLAGGADGEPAHRRARPARVAGGVPPRRPGVRTVVRRRAARRPRRRTRRARPRRRSHWPADARTARPRWRCPRRAGSRWRSTAPRAVPPDWALQRRLSPDFAAHIDRMKADIEAFKKAMPPEYPIAAGLADNKEPSDLKIFLRGNPYAFGEDAPRAFLQVLSDGEPKPFTKGSGRLELAEDIVKQPIAMRVIVNRIWRWNMGTGIVDTPNNFGFAGERPTNPELLDYLASKFVDEGMSWKKLTKEIVMSRTYQLSSAPFETNLAKDQDNRFYWRANRRRLEAEGIWDGLLSASGKLDMTKVGGPSEELDAKMTRRGMYGAVSRVFPNDFQTLFDSPLPTLSAERRYTTNVALQRLFFLNNEFVHKQAAALAERVKGAGNEEAQVRKAFEIVYQRDPSAEELSFSVALLHDSSAPAAAEPAPGPRFSFKAAAFAAKPMAMRRRTPCLRRPPRRSGSGREEGGDAARSPVLGPAQLERIPVPELGEITCLAITNLVLLRAVRLSPRWAGASAWWRSPTCSAVR